MTINKCFFVKNKINMIPGTLVCFVLIFLISECFSQEYICLETYNVDSLLLVLPDQHSEDRIKTLNMLSISLCYEEFAKSKQYAIEAMNLSKELDYQKGIADSYRNLGHIDFYQSNFADALINYLESLQLYEKLDKEHTVAPIYFDIAKTHLIARNYEKAIEYANIALDKFREPPDGYTTINTVRDTTVLILGIAFAYLDLRMHDKAIEIYLKVLEIGKKNNFGNTEMMLINILAGHSYYWTLDYDSAKVYWDKALAFSDESPSIQALKYQIISSQANLFYAEGNIDSAKTYKLKAFEWYNENGFLFWAMVNAYDLASIHNEYNESVSAEKYYQQSENLFEEMLNKNSWFRYDSLKYVVSYGTELYFPTPYKQMKEMMWKLGKKMYYDLYQFNKKNKRTENALKYFVEYYNATDTVNNIIRSRETVELQTQYESERKDQQIEKLSLENELKESRLQQNSYFYFGSVGLLILILMFGYILFRQNRLKTNQQLILLQQKLFRSQMNPHFLFNSLSSIQNFIIREKPVMASDYLGRFSKLVRQILNNSIEEYVPLEDEINSIENYLELQKIRHRDMFEYIIELDEKIDPETTLVPPMLAQPFIENSIEHGFKHKEGKGNMSIKLRLNGDLISFVLEDDGVGREKAMQELKSQNKDHRSLSTDITRERLQVLSKKLRQKINLTIVDLKDDKGNPSGTMVTFDIPYKQ